MAKDLINALQEVRGVKDPGETAGPTEEDGIYHDIVRKTVEEDGVTDRLGEGLYGSMNAMYSGVQPVMDSIEAIEVVADHIDGTVDTSVVDVSRDLNGNDLTDTAYPDGQSKIVTVGTNIADVVTIADNMTDVTYFADIYQGPKAVEPSVRNDGTALQIGDLYFDVSPVDPVDYGMKTYSGSEWLFGYADAYSRSESDAFHRRVPMKVKATEDLARGTLVALVGFNQGEDAIEVGPTITQTDICIGIVDTAMLSGEFGDVIIRGLFEGMDTSTQAANTVMYSAGGGLATVTKPDSVYQSIAYIVRDHATNGAAMINIAEPVTRQNLGYTTGLTTGLVTSPDGTDATIPAATEAIAGLISAEDKTKLNTIEDSAKDDQTDLEIKTAYENNAQTNEYNDTEKEKVGYISVSQAVDLDAMELRQGTAVLDTASTDLSLAVNELHTDTNDHIIDTTGAHVASAISFAATTEITTTDTQSAIVEVESLKLDKAGGTIDNNLTVSGTLHTVGNITTEGTVDGVDIASEETRLANTSGNNTGDQTSSDFTHNDLGGVSADEHIDWTLTNAKDIHPDNYNDNTTTDVSITHGTINVTVVSSDGDNGIINAATAITAGVMTEAMYDDHLLNNDKVTNYNPTKADIDALGVDASTVNSLTVETAVPSGAVFTDTYRGITDSLAITDSTISASATAAKSLKDTADTLAGNVLQKDNTTTFTPDADYEPATKKYVDDNGGSAVASTAEAQAGTSDIVVISPLKMREGFNANGSAPVYAPRAWVAFAGEGTVAINGSGNVSSITDTGTGKYTVNLTTAIEDTNYAVVLGSNKGEDSDSMGFHGYYTKTTTSFRVASDNTGTTSTDHFELSATVMR